MPKSGIQFQNIDLQFYELYYEVFRHEQVRFHNISFARLLSVVVWSQQSSEKCDV